MDDDATVDLSAARALDSTVNADGRDHSISNQLQVSCPNCHSLVFVAVDTSLTDLNCESCGCNFSLVDQADATWKAPPLSKLGRFELIERIGLGSFGTVWKARDKDLDRTIAIKIPRAGLLAPNDQEKFFREARTAAQLRHSNIVSVHEVGRDGDSIYIVSDFVRGVTLTDWLTGRFPTYQEVTTLCVKIAEALHHAHEQGVIHRDLKPSNIMVDGNREPHLMDFGLARRIAGDVTMTVDGQVLGTPAYMSPEQAEGKSHNADRRSDIYSLGVILYQLLTGELPFRGSSTMILHQVLNNDPPSPRSLNSSIPKDLETIALKCLEKKPANRYQTGAEVSAELNRYLSHLPLLARPIGPIERMWRWGRRNPAWVMVGASLFLTMQLAIVLFFLHAVSIERDRATLAEHQANIHLKEALAAKAELDVLRSEAVARLDNLIRALFDIAEKSEDKEANLSEAQHVLEEVIDSFAGSPVSAVALLSVAVNNWNREGRWELAERIGTLAGGISIEQLDPDHPFRVRFDRIRQNTVNKIAGDDEISIKDELGTPYLEPANESLRDFVGKRATVRFRVLSIGGHTHIYLNSQADYRAKSNFGIMIATNDIAKLPALGYGDPWKDFIGEIVEVKGVIEPNKLSESYRIVVGDLSRSELRVIKESK